jgi:hypothetical protein
MTKEQAFEDWWKDNRFHYGVFNKSELVYVFLAGWAARGSISDQHGEKTNTKNVSDVSATASHY